jgi:predicted nuclease with TOPRIM domain
VSRPLDPALDPGTETVTVPRDVTDLVRRIAELEGENEALRRSVAARSRAVDSLFERLMAIEGEHAWLVEAVRRTEFLAGAEGTLGPTPRELELERELAAIQATKTFRVAAPVRRWYSIARDIAERSKPT